MGGLESGFQRMGEGAGFGFTAECHRVLVEPDLPLRALRFCQFFYQDLHC